MSSHVLSYAPLAHAICLPGHACTLCHGPGIALYRIRSLVCLQLKPGNHTVETDVQGRQVVRVIDLGAAAFIPKGSCMVHEAQYGTPGYMAPESAASPPRCGAGQQG